MGDGGEDGAGVGTAGVRGKHGVAPAGGVEHVAEGSAAASRDGVVLDVKVGDLAVGVQGGNKVLESDLCEAVVGEVEGSESAVFC